jgi:tryptophan synthase beta chain
MYRRLAQDADFQREFDEDLAHYVGRPSPLYEARRWSDESAVRASSSSART